MSECIAIDEIIGERARQDETWGEQNHEPGYWLMILQEEIGEFCRAVQEGDAIGTHEELVQVAAVAFAMVECGHRNGWYE